ncbi:MAG: histidinol-phosphatase HisJ family protein [Dethiobacter sp.]|jgi:histidinol-phosphatase (PHP family)|nr:histidinol-phosphatase HisJ family protein [Dethiobacter sp.]MBS3900795.1 histidinol-phosphatase HisJ family protein [Dethiobacter sp.]MBS3988757.1 histidinol-phosphatase HisJ family protein [Dethiobacter sp.]
MFVDYHLHTVRCCHASGTLAEYLAEAEKKGLAEIGFADHFPLDLFGVTEEEPLTMRASELPDYIRDVELLRRQATIPVRLGAEVEYLPGRERETAEMLARCGLDYVIGSIHTLDGWDFTHPGQAQRYKQEDIDFLYERYFALVQQMASSQLFQIIGHLDVVKKFSYFPRRRWEHLLEDTCRAIKQADVCVELNTAGWRAPVGEAYPGEAFLAKCYELNVPVTMGSDAHRPRDVGSGLHRAVLLLHNLGFKEIATFNAGQRQMRPLILSG